MIRVWGVAAVLTLILGAILVFEGQPERRYAELPCQYRITYGQNLAAGLVAFGGSRFLTSMDADDFNALLDVTHPEHLPMINASHSHYSIEREYVLIRDFLEQQSAKTLLVMIQPRRFNKFRVHEDFAPSARISDLPLIVSALAGENPLELLSVAGRVVSARLTRFFRGAALDLSKFPAPTTNCHKEARLDLAKLATAETRRVRRAEETLKWRADAASEHYNRVFIRKISELAQANDVALFFHYLPRTTQSLPLEGFADDFEAATGARILVFDRDLQAQLSLDGRRDQTHINAAGRVLFQPWLANRISEVCPEERECF